MIYPEGLKKGDKIAILSPSSPVKDEYIRGAVDFFRAEGFVPVEMDHAGGPSVGSYASAKEDRLGDLMAALEDKTIKAVLCSRGGYGAVHLLRDIALEKVVDNPKWLIGYSDISALHALFLSAGVASIHAPMAKHLSEENRDDFSTRSLMRILEDDFPIVYDVASNDHNICGEAEGMLAGGNLAVLNGLFGTDYDILREGTILFIEDISEAIYAVERMLYHILLSGGFDKIKGLIVGRFTEYKSDRNYSTMEDMISSFLEREGITGIPVAFDFPVGHVRENYPLVEGSTTRLEVKETEVKLIMRR